MNNIFKKNINALATKDNELATKLANYVVTDIPQLVKENNFYNLLYKGVNLHNPQNPLGEAKEIFLNQLSKFSVTYNLHKSA